jgi:hypothetical protein
MVPGGVNRSVGSNTNATVILIADLFGDRQIVIRNYSIN